MEPKILQLYRSTNIWLTKNQAKAKVETNAKHLHVEYPEYMSLKDGEPIVARYYDSISGYNFAYTSLGSTDPYTGAYSAEHLWTENFDSFETMPVAANVNAESAAYIRVGGKGTPYTYYELSVTEAVQDEGVRSGVSSIFGVVYKSNEHMYIEWFDSAADAQGAIDQLNYTDKDLVNGFVAAVHQNKGQIESIHGTISGNRAVNIAQSAYKYVKLAAQPGDWVATTDNVGTEVPTGNLDETAPKYYYVVNDPAGEDDGYYELRKDIAISLVISDSTNNILAQGITQTYTWSEATSTEPSNQTWVDSVNSFATEGAIPEADPTSPRYVRFGTTGSYQYKTLTITNTNDQANVGLSTNLTLRQLDPTETLALGANVKEAYKLVGTASGNETQIGDYIKIYKDSSLYRVYLGHVDDELTSSTDPTVIDGDGNDALCFIYQLADGTYELVAVDVEMFLAENEFKDGLEIIQGYRYGNCDESEVTSGYVWDTTNEFATEQEAEAVAATSSSPDFLRWGVDPDWTYLKKEHQGEVYVKLANDGGLEFKDAGVGANKSVGINIDRTNTYFRTAETGETGAYSKVTIYEWSDGTDTLYTINNDGKTAQSLYEKTTIDADPAYPDALVYTGDDLYAVTANSTTADSDAKTFEEGGYIKVGGVNYNATGKTYGAYIADANGHYVLSEILYTNTDGLGIHEEMIEELANASIQNKLVVNNESFVYNPTTGKLEATVTANDVDIAESADTMPTVLHVDGTTLPSTEQNSTFIEMNGVIYKWNGTSYAPYTIGADTTVAEGLTILNYLTYNLDMGTYTIQ